MEIYRTLRVVLVSAALLGFSSMSHAIPTLTFGGDVFFDASTNELTFDGSILGSQSIATDVSGSRISLSTTLSSVSSGVETTDASFGSGTLAVFDDGLMGTDYLTGIFSSAQMSGDNGDDFGTLTLFFSPTSGTLLDYFSDPSDLIMFTFNLSTTFGENMFGDNISGFGNGNIISREVYEPGVLSLLLMGIGLVGASGMRRLWTAR